jgi:hypothetical protein
MAEPRRAKENSTVFRRMPLTFQILQHGPADIPCQWEIAVMARLRITNMYDAVAPIEIVECKLCHPKRAFRF